MARRGFPSLRGFGRTLITGKQLGDIAIGSIAGAAAIAGTTMAIRKLAPASVAPHWRAVMQAGAGLLIGGVLIRNPRTEAAGIGFAAGSIGYAAASLALGALDQPLALGGLRGLRGGLRGMRGADIREFRPGAPRLAPVTRPSPLSGGRGLGAVVINEQNVPSYLLA